MAFYHLGNRGVVIDTTKIQLFKQITTYTCLLCIDVGCN